MTLEQRFKQYEDSEYIKFDRVENKRNNRPDINAFLLLDELCPGNIDMISAAEHDEFYLSVDSKILETTITDQQILELVRCGVRYDGEYDCLCMFA